MLSRSRRVELGCRFAIRALLLNEDITGEKFLPMYFELEFQKDRNKCH